MASEIRLDLSKDGKTPKRDAGCFRLAFERAQGRAQEGHTFATIRIDRVSAGDNLSP